jgi:hypothetical protein
MNRHPPPWPMAAFTPRGLMTCSALCYSTEYCQTIHEHLSLASHASLAYGVEKYWMTFGCYCNDSNEKCS